MGEAGGGRSRGGEGRRGLVSLGPAEALLEGRGLVLRSAVQGWWLSSLAQD